VVWCVVRCARAAGIQHAPHADDSASWQRGLCLLLLQHARNDITCSLFLVAEHLCLHDVVSVAVCVAFCWCRKSAHSPGQGVHSICVRSDFRAD
jgi:hypothetical protein